MMNLHNFNIGAARNKPVATLTREQLERRVPSAFALTAAPTVGNNYKQYRTIELIDVLQDYGWQPFEASESRVVAANRQGFQKHMIRMRKGDEDLRVGDAEMNMVLINSHDGKSAYQLTGGIYVLKCSNGLMVCEESFQSLRVRHTSHVQEEIIDAQVKVLDNADLILEGVQNMKALELDDQERDLFAKAALMVRWEDEQAAPIRPRQLLDTRYNRRDEQGKDLWTTFNVVQENLIKGGVRGRNQAGGRTTTREIKAVDANIKVNKALHFLATEFAKLKAS